MVRVNAGDYVLFTRDLRPSWPAVIIPRDMVPRSVRHDPARNIAILLLGKMEVIRCNYADLIGLGKCECTEEEGNKFPGLREAYTMLDNAIFSLHGLSYWKIEIENNYMDDGPLPEQLDPDEDSDIQEAIRTSLTEVAAGKRPAPCEDNSDSDNDTSSPSPAKRSKPSPERLPMALPIRNRTGGTMRNTTATSNGFHGTPFSADPEIGMPGPSRTRIHPRLTPPSEEDDEEEIYLMMHRKDMATWLIGPESDRFHIPLTAVTSRPHLKKMDILLPNGKEGWKVFKPSFDKIDPDKFRPVAEFLCTGDFHVKTSAPDGTLLSDADMNSASIELYAGAWEVAEMLSLHDDMMTLIVQKMRALQPWPFLEVLSFTSTVYAVESRAEFPVYAQLEMRELLVKFLKENFAKKLVQQKMRQYPELRRDVHLSLANDADEEVKRGEDDDEEEEG